MVERLKAAIEKARAEREALHDDPASPVRATAEKSATEKSAAERPTGDAWSRLPEIALSEERLRRERIVAHEKRSPANISFDILRTRLYKVCRDNGWKRIAVTSPTKGCGKSFVSTNLALSFARHEQCRTVLIDLDLRAPQLAHILGQKGEYDIRRFLLGETAPETYFNRVGGNLAVGLNSRTVSNSSELLQSAATGLALGGMIKAFRPEIVICDMPPLLVSDDVIALLPNIDCVLLVAGAGQTRARDIAACEQALPEGSNFLGVVMNKSRDDARELYQDQYA